MISSTQCNAFIRVDALERFLAQLILNSFLNSRNSGRTADHQNRCAQATVGQCLLNRTHSCIDQILGQFVELCNAQRQIQVLRASCICCNKRQVDVGSGGGGQFNLCLFCCFLQSLHCHLIAGEVNAFCCLKFADHPVDDSLVEVIAAQTVVTSGCQNLLYAIAHFDDGNVERTAAEVVNHNLLIFFLINSIRKCSSSRLVDDSLYIQTSDLTSVLGSLTLCIGEVCRNSDNSFCNRLTQISFCILLQLGQDHSGDFLRGILLTVNFYFIIGTHMSLDGRNGSFRVCNSLTLCDLTNQTFAGFGETNDRRCGSCTFCICNYDSVAAFHNSNTGVCCTQVNTNNFSHNKLFLSSPAF